MTDKVQKIKEWISKEQDGLMNAQGNFEYPEHEGAYHILCNLDAYIDSLQEEPVSEDFEEALAREWKGYNDRGSATVDALEDNTQELAFAKGFYHGWHYRKEEPVSEKKCMFTKDNYTDEDRKVLCVDCDEKCKYSKKEEPVSEELEEAAKQYAMEKYPWQHGYESWDSPIKDFKAGSQWKEKHLWKDAQGDDLPEIRREVIALIQDWKDVYKVVFAHRPNPDGWNGKSLTTGEVEHYTPKTYDKGGWNMPNVKKWLDIKLPKEIEE